MKMKMALLCGAWLSAASLFAQTSAFTYQGRLAENGAPATGVYDLRFTIYDALTSGHVVGIPQTNAAVTVSNGLFTTTLDFGANVFNGAALWLDIAARTNGSGLFISLNPRQPLTSAPYAVQAAKAAAYTGAIADGQLSANVARLNVNAPFTSKVTFDPASGAPFGVGNANKVVDLNADLLDGLTARDFWQLGGNSSTTPGGNFLGTTDNAALELKVNNQRALRLEPTTNSGAVNVIGGSSGNYVTPGTVGAVIAGGGTTNFAGVAYTNRVSGNFTAIGGGGANTIVDSAFAVIGGGGNTVQANAYYATLGGGVWNQIKSNAQYSTLAGGYQNVIDSSSISAFIGGGAYNWMQSMVDSGVIAGGQFNTMQTNSDFAAIGGGGGNSIGTNSSYATISGGQQNAIQFNSEAATIAGGVRNVIQTNAENSFIGGGVQNIIAGNAISSVIGGGITNKIHENSGYSVIAGGLWNDILHDASAAAISGGYGNEIQPYSYYAVIGGGGSNVVQGVEYARSGAYGTIGGGYLNTISSNAPFAAIPGGYYAHARSYGQMAYASGRLNTAGDAQTSTYVLRRSTTTTNQTELFLDGINQRMNVPSGGRWAFEVLVSAGSSTGAAGYTIKGVIKNVGGTTSLTGTAPTTVMAEDVSAWDVVAEADNTNDALVIKVTGVAGTTIRWVATVRTSELVF